MHMKNRSVTITDPFLQSELEQKQPRVKTVYALPDTAPDGTVLILNHEGEHYECTRSEDIWLYKPLYSSVEDASGRKPE